MKPLIFIFLFLSFKAYPQNLITIEPDTQIDAALVIIDNTVKTNWKSILFHPYKLASTKTLNPSQAVSKYGENAKNGAIEMKFAVKIRFVSVDSLYKHFKINPADQKLNIVLNKKLIADKNKILIDEDLMNRLTMQTAETINHVTGKKEQVVAIFINDKTDEYSNNE